VSLSQGAIASGMILASGAAHAVVNAVLKSGKDKMSSRALIDGFSAIIVAPFVFFLPLPIHAWPWLLGSLIDHLFYLYCLIKAFEAADMSVAYPIARGAAPVLAAAMAVVIFHEQASWLVGGGVALVSVGVMIVGIGRHASLRSIGWALATGVTIAIYTVLDAQGVRVAPSAPSYIAWFFLIVGVSIGGLFAVWRGPVFILEARSQWKPGLLAGAASIFSYGLAIWAFRLGATPRLAALRETSILFGVAIAVVFLKERVNGQRLAGVATIAAGAMVLLASG
jgi:drug/metabolite transporter (DMT)-like permease